MNRRYRHTTTSLPGVVVAFVPKAVCPICSPAYTAVLSSLGLPFLATATYLLPITTLLLSLAVGSLYFGAARRRGRGPFWLGMIAAAALLSGKFWIDSVVTVHAGVAVLIAASVWNAIPKRSRCPACEAAVVQ